MEPYNDKIDVENNMLPWDRTAKFGSRYTYFVDLFAKLSNSSQEPLFSCQNWLKAIGYNDLDVICDAYEHERKLFITILLCCIGG